MRIAIYGCGGVGGYFGGRLAQIGQDVTFIARGKTLEALRNRGLRVDSISGDFQVKSVKATDKPKEVGEVDFIICAVKDWQVVNAAKAMKPMVGPETLVIPLQNGVEAPSMLMQELDEANVLGGMCALIAFQAGPGHIKHIGASPLVQFGHLDKRPNSNVNRIAEIFSFCSGLKANIPADINSVMWEKFLLISPWSGMGAVTRAPLGTLLKNNETREMMRSCMQEIQALAKARDIALPEDIIERTMRALEAFPKHSTASMQRDIVDGLPSELDAQCGSVVRLAHESGVEVPVNEFLLTCLSPQELRARGALKF